MLSMLDLTRVKRLLCLGAHCDDIEIGAGGTIMRLAHAERTKSTIGSSGRFSPKRGGAASATMATGVTLTQVERQPVN